MGAFILIGMMALFAIGIYVYICIEDKRESRV